VAFLSGARLQGRMGLGWSAMSSARDVPAADRPSLELRDVDRAFGEIARVSGAGAIAERSRLLAALFGKSTIVEQAFLIRLISGELRQGAVEGVLAEAIAKAAGAAVDAVRQAAMMCGNLGEVAHAASSTPENHCESLPRRRQKTSLSGENRGGLSSRVRHLRTAGPLLIV
jgi:DNA ligase 1